MASCVPLQVTARTHGSSFFGAANILYSCLLLAVFINFFLITLASAKPRANYMPTGFAAQLWIALGRVLVA